MLRSNEAGKSSLIATLLIALAGCAQPAVKDIAANKTGYLDENFSPQKLPADVGKQVAAAEVKSPSRTLRITLNATLEDSGKKETPVVLATVKVLGNGLVQEMQEYSNNGIPYAITYALSYMGLFPLKEQRVFYSRPTANLPTEVKQLNQLARNLVRPNENAEYVFEWLNGTSMQIANFSNIKLVCNSGKFYPAAQLHSNLSGNAIDLNCTRQINGVVRVKHKYVMLLEYGFVLKLDQQSSTNTEAFKVVGVDVL